MRLLLSSVRVFFGGGEGGGGMFFVVFLEENLAMKIERAAAWQFLLLFVLLDWCLVLVKMDLS